MAAQPKPFLSIPEAAELLGEHRVTVYHRAKKFGHVNGVPVTHKTPTTMVVSRARLERAIAGEPEPEPTPGTLDHDWFERT